MRHNRLIKRSLAYLGAVCVLAGTLTPVTASASTDGAGELGWGQCPTLAMASPDTRCAEVEVPRDYSHPDAGTITVTVSRIPATGEYKGTIAGNPGGPGGSALGMFNPEIVTMPEQVREHFDLIAVQPRGLVWANPLVCPGVPVASNQNYVGCQAWDLGFADTITTENTARDLNSVRERLGVEKINLYGLSYGVDLMSTYATLFPEHTAKTVLDSGVDPNARYADLGLRREASRREAFNEMLAWIASRNDQYGLGETPLMVYQRWAERINKETGQPGVLYPPPAQVGDLPAALGDNREALLPLVNHVLPDAWRTTTLLSSFAPSSVDPSRLDPLAGAPVLQFTLMNALYSQHLWPNLAHALATGSNPSIQVDNSESFIPQGEPEFDQEILQDLLLSQAAYRGVEAAIVCNDNINAIDITRRPQADIDVYLGGDIFSANSTQMKSGQFCQGWPPRGKAVQWDGSRLQSAPLVLGYDNDTATGKGSAQDVQAVMGGELVLLNGYSHGVLGATNDPDVVAKQVANYYLGD